MLFILDENKEVVKYTGEPLGWLKWMNDNKEIKHDYVEEVVVSTVFLGVATYKSDFFETMVFGDDNIKKELVRLTEEKYLSIMNLLFGDKLFQRRYSTYSEALEGHEETLSLVKKIVENK